MKKWLMCAVCVLKLSGFSYDADDPDQRFAIPVLSAKQDATDTDVVHTGRCIRIYMENTGNTVVLFNGNRVTYTDALEMEEF